MRKNLLFLGLMLLGLCACNEKIVYKSFEEYPVYEGEDLGLTYSPQSCKFRIWAPTADDVKILLYDNGQDGGAYQTHDMDEAEDGTWTLKLDENLKGKYYTYQIKIGEKWLEETPGMLMKATSFNGERAAIIDLAETGPSGWDNDTRPHLEDFGSMIVYELHLRDFTVGTNSGIKHKGKFLGLTEHGTRNSAGETTGIDYLKELGVTHVQLMPVADFASIDESSPNKSQYSRGYDVLNFSVPEGSYATDAKNPSTRIREFKEMIMAFHKAGIRVNMEVVYNHTAFGKGSNLDLLAPGYFYRQNPDSSWANSLRVGNELATERGMVRKLIVQSLTYWASEMHIDGFCFSGMGAMDTQTINDAREALDKIDPTISMYGDGRIIEKTPLKAAQRADWPNANSFSNVGYYAYGYRDAILGTGKPENLYGFVGQTDSLEQSIRFGVVAGVGNDSIDYSRVLYTPKPYVITPVQTFNLLSAQDSLSLMDKLRQNPALSGSTDVQAKAAKLAQSMLFTSLGIPVIRSGDEVLSTKGLSNSASADSLYRLDWSLRTSNWDYFNYCKGLIQLRKAHKAFQVSDKVLLRRQMQFLWFDVPQVVGFMWTNHANGDEWKDILVLYNGSLHPVNVNVPEGDWMLVCHDGQINQNGLGQFQGGSFMLPGISATVMYKP